jgi:Transposase IS116/IS110/IS902 family
VRLHDRLRERPQGGEGHWEAVRALSSRPFCSCEGRPGKPVVIIRRVQVHGRAFRNRQEVGALSGLTPTPYASGNTAYEQGIAKAGNAHIRAMAIEIAWGWLRFQPQSALTQWYQQRFGHGRSRLRRSGIVALARQLLMALWRFVETGVVPDGAALKAAGRR